MRVIMKVKFNKTQIRLNAATLKESPAKGYQHFAKSAMKDQISLGNQLFDQNHPSTRYVKKGNQYINI